MTFNNPKPLRFCGNSLGDLRAFPEVARREAGHQIDQVQRGLDPDSWKPMKTVGPGVREIRVKDQTGIFRIIYVAQFEEAIYVLHCFGKKTEKTAKSDLDIANRRLRALKQERRG
jgi:phage-related protein